MPAERITKRRRHQRHPLEVSPTFRAQSLLRSGPQASPWVVCLSLGLVAVLLHGLLPLGGIWRTVAFHVVSASAVGLALLGFARNRPSRRIPWLLIAAGQILFVAADLGWGWLDVVGDALAVIGLLLLVRQRMAGRMIGGLIDAAIMTTAVAALSWTYVLRPLATASGLDPLSTGHNLGFPAADLVLVAAALALLTAPGARTISLMLLGLSLSMIFAADQAAAIHMLTGLPQVGGLAATLHLLAFVLFAVAALHPSMHHLTDEQPPAATWLGYARQAGLAVAMLTGPLLFLIGPSEPRTAIGVATATMSVLVLLRLVGLVRLLESDVAGRRLLEAVLTHQALHDPVTGLANRRQFVSRAEAALAARQHPGSIAALFIDLDDFKAVNDNLGHAAGDQALALVAERIQGVLRDGDLAARLGGDEFGVLVCGLTSPDDARHVGNRIVAALARPLELASKPVVVGASIGTAIDRPGDGVDELLGRADLAMYRAKGHHAAADGRPVSPHRVERHIRGIRTGDLAARSVG